MVVGFFLSSESSGGGYNQNLSFLSMFKDNKFENYQIKIFTDNYNLSKFLKSNNIEFIYFNKNFFNLFIFKLFNFLFIKKIFIKLNIKNPFLKLLTLHNVDLIIFNSPSYYVNYCDEINYVSSIWNTEVRTFNNFREFVGHNFNYQDNLIKKIIKEAFKIFVFSNENKIDLIKYYSCDENKIVTQSLIPYLPKLYEQKKNLIDFEALFSKLGLSRDKKWIFYPAQFWSHKNHKYVIDAIQFLNGPTCSNVNFVFTGNDKGNLNYIKKIINKKNLNNRFKIFGYLSDEEVISIYKNCFAVSIPTYVGRSSLPLLESLFFKKTIFYSEKILDIDFYDKVIGINLKDPEDLSNKIHKYCSDVNLQNKEQNNLRDFYYNICSEKKMIENYLNVINEYNYISLRWQDK